MDSLAPVENLLKEGTKVRMQLKGFPIQNQPPRESVPSPDTTGTEALIAAGGTQALS